MKNQIIITKNPRLGNSFISLRGAFSAMLPLVAAACMIPVGVCCAAAQGSAVEFSYTLSKEGKVSAAIYDSSGRMVRPLLYGAQQAPGTYRLSWDGLDRNGQPQPSGKYEWRVLRTPGFTREFMVNLGTNITWREHDYWPGNHYGPNSVMVDGEGALYVGSVSSEGPPHLISLTQDGRTLNWAAPRFGVIEGGLTDLVRCGNKLFVLLTDGRLSFLEAGRGDKGGKFADLRHAREKADRKNPAMRLAGGKDFLVVCYKDFDEVRFLWPKDDKFERDETVSVPQPISAAVAPDGTVYVVSPTGIVAVDVATKQTKKVVEDKELTKPGALAFDPVFGDLLVTNGSQVRRYHAADGKLVAVYGRQEGRIYGVFNPLEFDTLLSLTADGKGGFFTAELCPRRVAHFTGREKHQLVQEWFGGMSWECQALVDPVDPTIAFLPIDYKHIGRAVIDYEKKSWTLTHLYETPDEFSWGSNKGDTHRAIFPQFGGLAAWSVRRVEGKTYLVNTLGSVMVVRVDEDRIVPVAHLGALHPSSDRQNPPEWWIAALKRIGIDADSQEGRGTYNPKSFKMAGEYKHFAYSWADTNRNGRFDVEEVALGSVGNALGESMSFVDNDWTIYARDPSGKQGWVIIPNEGKDPGFPSWNWDHLRQGAGAYPPQGIPRAYWADKDGSVYAVVKFGDRDSQDFPPLTWPNNRITTDRLCKWDSRGNLLFATGYHTARKDGPAGGFADLRAFVGQIRGNLIVRDACAAATVWTPDGLYAGKVSRETMPNKWLWDPGLATREDPSLGPWSDDSFGTLVMETAKGDVLWLANDVNNTMVIRIKGWDGWERQKGSLSLGAELPAAGRQGDGLAAEYFDNNKLEGQPVLQRVDRTIWFGVPRGDHFYTKLVNPWARQDDKVPIDPGTLSARWTGFIESPVSEDFTFVAYTYGKEAGKLGAKLRLWVDGKLVLDSWDEFEPKPLPAGTYVYTRALRSPPIPMTAGRRVPIKIEYAAAGGADAHLHMFWESLSCDPRHVPAEALYRNPTGGDPRKDGTGEK